MCLLSLLLEEDREMGEDDQAELQTVSEYNNFGELVKQIYPEGNKTKWTYDRNKNLIPSSRGNLLEVKQIAADNGKIENRAQGTEDNVYL